VVIAAGLDPGRCTLFVQSHIPAHAELHWLPEATAYDGELRRMVQYREKAGLRL
jgi:tryptophanyl-tRNA synthetase